LTFECRPPSNASCHCISRCCRSCIGAPCFPGFYCHLTKWLVLFRQLPIREHSSRYACAISEPSHSQQIVGDSSDRCIHIHRGSGSAIIAFIVLWSSSNRFLCNCIELNFFSMDSRRLCASTVGPFKLLCNHIDSLSAMSRPSTAVHHC
jgi:hypothetical protein